MSIHGEPKSVDSPTPREAVMNPTAVSEAKVYTGEIHYHDGEMKSFTDKIFVEIGNWTGMGSEQTPEDYLSTYHAAVMLGIPKSKIDWLPTQGQPARKLLVTTGHDQNGPIGYSTEAEAQKLADSINKMLAAIKGVQEESLR